MLPELDIHIGARLWLFDDNRRVYAKPAPGQLYGPLIWKEHWREEEVIGETSRSWLVGPPGTKLDHHWAITKLAKKLFLNGHCPPGWARSRKFIDQQAWVFENRHDLIERLRRCDDYTTMRNIASMLGLVENDSK